MLKGQRECRGGFAAVAMGLTFSYLLLASPRLPGPQGNTFRQLEETRMQLDGPKRILSIKYLYSK